MTSHARMAARLASLEGLHELVDALRAIAASHAREAGEALGGTRRYRGVIDAAIAAAGTLEPDAAAAPRDGDGAVLIVICSEHGFVGGFNQRIVAHAAEARTPAERLILVGRRGAMRAAESGLATDDVLAMTTHVAGVPALARRLGDRLGPVARARIVHAAARPGARFEAVTRTLLPLPAAAPPGVGRSAPHSPGAEGGGWAGGAGLRAGAGPPPLHHLPPHELLARLGDELLFAEIAHALMESLASENGARLHAMEAAGRNIGHRLDVLRQEANTLRQQEITADLLEVVSGAEAVAERTAGVRQDGAS